MSRSRTKVLLWYWGRRGGGPRYTYELARALLEDGDLELHLSLSRQSEIFDEFATLQAPGWHIDTYTGLGQAAAATLRLPLVRHGFWRYVADQEIDLVVGTMSHIWNVPVLLGRRSRPPYLLVLHDALPHKGDDVPLRGWLLGKETTYADGVVTLTQHVRDVLCTEHGYPSSASWVVPHGVFAYARGAMRRAAKGRPHRLLFFGRLLPYKGLDLLLEAFGLLRERRQDVELVIAGPGDAAPYKGQIDQLAGVHLDNRWIEEGEIGAIFRGADICVLPYREASQSGVVATAYAAGIPVVTTPVGGLVEQVHHERTGIVCEAVSAEAIASAVARLLDSPQLMQKCAHGAAREAEENLAWPAIAGRFKGVVDEVLRRDREQGGRPCVA